MGRDCPRAVLTRRECRLHQLPPWAPSLAPVCWEQCWMVQFLALNLVLSSVGTCLSYMQQSQTQVLLLFPGLALAPYAPCAWCLLYAAASLSWCLQKRQYCYVPPADLLTCTRRCISND